MSHGSSVAVGGTQAAKGITQHNDKPSPGEVLKAHIKRVLGDDATNITAMKNGQVVFNFDSNPEGRATGIPGNGSRGLSATYLAIIRQGGRVDVSQIPSNETGKVLKGLQLPSWKVDSMGGEASTLQTKLNPPNKWDETGYPTLQSHKWPKMQAARPLPTVECNATSEKIKEEFPDAKIHRVMENGTVLFSMQDPQPGTDADDVVAYIAYDRGDGQIEAFSFGYVSEREEVKDRAAVILRCLQLGFHIGDGVGNGLMTIEEKLNS